MSVGVGEGILAPAAYSMIADYAEPVTRGRAIYMSSNAIGTGLSLMIGGAVVGSMSGQPGVVLPLLGDFAAWQAAFTCRGAGIDPALLMFDVRTGPPRRSGGLVCRRQFRARLRRLLEAYSVGATRLRPGADQLSVALSIGFFLCGYLGDR